jgi:hypothetical protein
MLANYSGFPYFESNCNINDRISLKINFDDNWSKKWGADAINAIRRLLTHAQNIWQWSSAPSKMVFKVDPDVRQLAGTWTASGSL